MLSKIIKPGDRIELRTIEKSFPIKNELLETVSKTYMSQVHGFLSEERMEIVMPMEGTKLILLPVDAVYDMYLTTNTGLYQCFIKIVDRYKSNNVYLVVAEMVSNLRKYQRRDYYRFTCALEMQSRELNEEELEQMNTEENFAPSDLPMKHSVIVDISGGGLRFLSNQEYETGKHLNITYALMIKEKPKNYQVIGKILASKPSEYRKGVYEYRVQFVNMKNDDREDLIKYIFEEERKHRNHNV